MLFNSVNLEPLFEFKIGQPGSSFTFEVAQINGVPDSLINKAKGKLNKDKLKLNELLSDLQRKTNTLDKEIEINKEEAAQYQERSITTLQSKEKLSHKFEKVNQTIQLHELQLSAGKKMLEFIEEFKNSKNQKVNQDLGAKVMTYLKEQKTKKEVKTKSHKSKKKLSKKQVASYQQEKICLGSQVKIIATKQIAIVEELKGKQTTLSIGNTRIKVALDKLIWVS